MERTILIGLSNKFSISTTKRLTIITGLFFLIYGIVNIDLYRFDSLGNILAILLILLSILNIVFGLTAFSVKSKYAMRLKVNDSFLEFKSSYLRPATTLKWEAIKEIKFDAYKIDFHLSKRKETFRYRSNPEVSIEIKQTLREIAHERNIPIKGG